MSVLSFPRIYFKGYMGWDPTTANNNDYLPTYDMANAALNWEFVKEFGFTEEALHENPTKFREDFREWIIQPEEDSCPQGSAPDKDSCTTCKEPSDPAKTTAENCHMASRWDYYGGGGCWFVNGKNRKFRTYKTVTTGGDLAYGQPASPDDPILGKPITLAGNSLGGEPGAARLVDINPGVPWSSQVFFGTVKAGDEKTFIGGPRYRRMHSRSFMVPRNISSELIIAGAIGVVFQTTIPLSSVDCSSGGSALLAKLIEAMNAEGAEGLMMRFSAYNTLYYENAYFNGNPITDCDSLYQAYKAGGVFMNPAYSLVAGAFGVWKKGELASIPSGHFLVPNAEVTPVSASPAAVFRGKVSSVAAYRVSFEEPSAAEALDGADSGPPPLAFGSVSAEVDYNNQLVSLDMSNAIPEYTVEGAKFDYGTITLGVQILSPGGPLFEPINSFDFSQYNLEAYQAKAGIVDVPFGPGVTPDDLRGWLGDGKLALQVVQGAEKVIASLERPLTAETDRRGFYVDECRIAEFKVQVRYKNGPPPAGTKIRLAQYFAYPLNVSSGYWIKLGVPAPSNGDPAPVCKQTASKAAVKFLDGDVIDVVDGEATVRLEANDPNFPIIAFFPFLPGEDFPPPADTVNFGFSGYSTPSIDNAFFATGRVMAFDNALVPKFVDRWNGTGEYAGQPKYDRTLTWLFIYENILYVYDMLFPVMDQFMPLNNLVRVEGAIDQLVRMVQEEWVVKSTLYMPVTRDLSAGKRLILETWGNLVNRKYPQEPLPPLSVKCDVTSQS